MASRYPGVVRVVALMIAVVGGSAWAQAEGSALAARRERMIKEGKLVPDRVPGTIDREGVTRAFVRRLPAVSRCAEEKLQRAPGGLPKVVVEFVVETNGKVHDVAIDGAPPSDAQYGACLVEVVKTLKVPKPKGGPVTIRYPFIICGTGY